MLFRSNDTATTEIYTQRDTLSLHDALPIAEVDVTFTPHLLPLPRGILSTAYGRLAKAATAAELTAVLRRRYEGEPFVRVHDAPDKVSLHAVVGTNTCAMAVSCEPRAGGRVVVVSALDNLVKGAAGQAVQNLNLLLGLPETAGLQHLRRFHP